MSVFYFKIGDKFPIMVVPETTTHLDGHPVLTLEYSLYKDISLDDPALLSNDGVNLKKKSNPNYLGMITFEIPNRVFNYVPDGGNELTSKQIREAVEQISHYRDNPSMWNQLRNN